MGEAQKCVAELDVDEVGATTVQLIWGRSEKKIKSGKWFSELLNPLPPLPPSALCMKTIFFVLNGQLMAISGGRNKFLPGPAISKS